MNYGQIFLTLRAVRKINQKYLAEELGVTQGYLSQVECDKKKPSLDLLEKVSEIYEIPLQALLWFSISSSDISEDKMQSFRILKPAVDSLISEFIKPVFN